jgi:uncharacterized protein YehS (DUF1456 family)
LIENRIHAALGTLDIMLITAIHEFAVVSCDISALLRCRDCEADNA